MERIDKIIVNQTQYSRKDVKKLVLQKRVKVNDILILKSDIKIDPQIDIITVDGKDINVVENVF